MQRKATAYNPYRRAVLALPLLAVAMCVVALMAQLLLWDASDGTTATDAAVPQIPPTALASAPSASAAPSVKRIEFGIAASLGREQSKVRFNQTYGHWPVEPCDPCRVNCLELLASAADAQPPVREWGQQALDDQIAHIFDAWKQSGGFTMDMQVNLNSCAWKTRTRWNPHGLWLHISGRNVTTLRMMADGYRRAGHIKQYIKDVVARSDAPFDVPLVVYVSVTDIPCNVLFPYLTFFGQRGVMGIVIPDDSFHKSVHGGSWEDSRRALLPLEDSIPFVNRTHKLFFRGSPTHVSRENLRQHLTTHPDSKEFADIRLAVVEKFKHFSVKLEDHAKYQFLLAARGKTASSRDKYLNLLGSTIVWAAEEEPWFQFYHTLWRPYVNYIPMTEENALCVVRMLNRSSAVPLAAKIAKRSVEVGRFLSQDVADAYLRRVLHQYAALQTYEVPADPIAFLTRFRSMVKKKYRSALVMPDDQNPVKFFFDKWLSRRIKQIHSCRTNNTYNGVQLPPDSKYRCWYM